MTWEESPWAHSLTEFGFDTLEVVARHMAPQKYHDWVGFKVPEPVLQRAFKRTYGLELRDQILNVRLALASYRESASQIIPGNDRGGLGAQKEGARTARLGTASRAALSPLAQELRSMAQDLYKARSGG